MIALRWLGTTCALIGAFVVAVNVPVSGWGFVLYLISSLSWLVAAIALTSIVGRHLSKNPLGREE